VKNIVIDVPYGKLEQGLIFNCGKAVNYVGCEVYGMLITARCDLTHDKIPIFHYLDIRRDPYLFLACE